MNIILFQNKDFNPDGTISIKDSRIDHILKVLKLSRGDLIKSGLKNGLIGKSKIIEISEKEIRLLPNFTEEPPKPLEVTLIIALPRPKAARRIIYTAAAMGIKKIYLINSSRVEKSYWQSPYLKENEIKRQIIKGLEQGFDTIFPQIIKHERFKPFAEDILPRILKKEKGYLLSPYSKQNFPKNPEKKPSALIIGPEGGFIPYENEKLEQAGADSFKLGERIMRVETSVTASVSRFI